MEKRTSSPVRGTAGLGEVAKMPSVRAICPITELRPLH